MKINSLNTQKQLSVIYTWSEKAEGSLKLHLQSLNTVFKFQKNNFLMILHFLLGMTQSLNWKQWMKTFFI